MNGRLVHLLYAVVFAVFLLCILYRSESYCFRSK